jgi:hypothetical protein
LSEINERFTELDPNLQCYLRLKAGARSLKALNFFANSRHYPPGEFSFAWFV